MRFEVSRVLDAIEARLTLDPALARAVVDLAELVRLADLDRDAGRAASLLRLGHVLDALGRHLAEDGVAVYVVVARSLLSDVDLSSNERMVVRRWADDGLVEVLATEAMAGSGADPADRVLEVAELLAVPVLSRRRFPEYAQRYRWLPRGLLAPAAAGLSTVGEGLPGPAGTPVLTRVWRCPEPACAGFGAPAAAGGSAPITPAGGQPPPRLRAAAPTCPRHGTRLTDAGPRPPARVLAVRVDGAVRGRFAVREAAPVRVGRFPAGADGAGGAGSVVTLGPLLSEEAGRWISRSHLRLELRGAALVVTDTSTNGTSVRTPGGPVPLHTGQAYGLGDDDVIELYQGVELGRPTRFQGGAARPASVMADAPTVSIRLPR
ncbi:MAG: FHA domain-containing protein [Micromonosporaceae bacterium]|nr:FHA domain-containing protein [Micromonosporaceae bacterium]